MKKLLTIAALLVLAVPTALAAPPAQGPSPAQLCRAQQAGMSAADFASLYAPANPKSAFGKCLVAKQQQIAQNTANAAKQCAAERAGWVAAAHGGKSFNESYGMNDNDRNAFGKCVSQKAKQQTEAQQAATLKAAKQCKADRRADATAFTAAYGTKKNAFGKCVSAKSRQNQS
jgi:hypothetical protein